MDLLERIDMLLMGEVKKIVYDCRACSYEKCKERVPKGISPKCTLKSDKGKKMNGQ